MSYKESALLNHNMILNNKENRLLDGEIRFGNNINLCFLYGKIISELDFEFVYNSKRHISKITFLMEIYQNKQKKCIVPIKAYDLLADNIYQNAKNGDYIYAVGEVENNCVEVKEIEAKKL